jgi:metal-responsive CopG/Arc/MetJ family transcriptional regulator
MAGKKKMINGEPANIKISVSITPSMDEKLNFISDRSCMKKSEIFQELVIAYTSLAYENIKHQDLLENVPEIVYSKTRHRI